MLSTIARYTILESLRNRMSFTALFFFIVSFFIAEFVGSLVLTEAVFFQTTLLSSMMRTVSVFVLSLFVISSCLKERQDRQLELLLSLPLHRYQYLLGKITGFFVMAFLLSFFLSWPILVYGYWQGSLIWFISLLLELMICASFCFFLVFTFQHLVPALTAFFIFYLLSRSMSAIQNLAENPLDIISSADQFMILIIKGINFLLPNLDHFCQSIWLVSYPEFSILLPLLSEAFLYICLINLATLIDF